MTAITRSPTRPAFAVILVTLGLLSGVFTISLLGEPGCTGDDGEWERGMPPMAEEGRGRGGPPLGRGAGRRGERGMGPPPGNDF